MEKKFTYRLDQSETWFVDNIYGLTLCQMTNFRLFQTERVLQMGRKQCGKRRNCLLRAIPVFPTVFSKDFYCRHVKTKTCLGKG